MAVAADRESRRAVGPWASAGRDGDRSVDQRPRGRALRPLDRRVRRAVGGAARRRLRRPSPPRRRRSGR
ncbi:MAG TPA: histidine kinase [Nannocystis exedens]|nr:histidine kinase [Nannocystis exedens]